MGKTGGGRGTNQHQVQGASKERQQGSGTLDDLAEPDYSSRFASKSDAAIYALTLDAPPDAETGDASDGGWYGLVHFRGNERERFGGDSAIVHENEDGFVDVVVLGDRAGAEARWVGICAEQGGEAVDGDGPREDLANEKSAPDAMGIRGAQ